MRRFRFYPRVVPLVILALLLGAAGPALAGDSKPRIVPVDEKAFGKSYEELSTEWWQWVYSLPAHGNPLFDETDQDFFKELDEPGSGCDAGQHGKVWFLAGNFGGTTMHPRTCTVPNGKALFFPVFNFETDNVRNPPTNFTAAQLEAECLALVAEPDMLKVQIDNVTLQTAQVRAFAIEPTPFRYEMPDEDNIYDFLQVPWSGELDQHGAISCGYYIYLEPLAKGKHHIVIEAQEQFAPDNIFLLKVEYDVTVSKSREKGK